MNISGQAFVVSGGAGFIGSHLVDELLRRGATEVRVLDQLAQSDNLGQALATGRVKIIECDITRPDGLANLLQGAAGLFHMAVLPLGPCGQEMRRCLEVNIVGAFNVFEAAQQAGVQRIVYSSASSVYGDTNETMDESHPLNARSMYGASKLASEYLLHAFGTHRGLKYAILRYMNVYGSRQKGGLINIVLGRIRQGQPPLIFGDGTQSFDFVHVADIVQANLLAMQSEVTGEAFNVGSGEEFTVNEIVRLLLQLTGSDLKPEYRPAPAGQMQRRVGSSEKAIKMLGYRPRLSLAEGLRRLVEGEQPR